VRDRTVRIALSGRSGSGKTTLARSIGEWLGANVESFSRPIKTALNDLLQQAGITDPSPLLYRRALQFLCDDLLHLFGHDFFVRALSERIAGCQAVIIDDLRTRVEMNWCREQGFFLVRLVGSFAPLPPSLSRHWTEHDLDDVDDWDLVLEMGDVNERTEMVIDRWLEWSERYACAGHRDDRARSGVQ
jgi:hypothetical protein